MTLVILVIKFHNISQIIIPATINIYRLPNLLLGLKFLNQISHINRWYRRQHHRLRHHHYMCKILMIGNKNLTKNQLVKLQFKHIVVQKTWMIRATNRGTMMVNWTNILNIDSILSIYGDLLLIISTILCLLFLNTGLLSNMRIVVRKML